MIASTGCGRRLRQSPSTFCGANETTRVAKGVKDRTQIGGGLIPAGRTGVPYFRYSRISTKLDTHTEDVGTTAIVRRAHGDWKGSDRVVPTDVAKLARIVIGRHRRRASNCQLPAASSSRWCPWSVNGH